MIRLRVQDVATEQGVSMSELQRRSNQTFSLLRRYWYNSTDGKANGKALRHIDLDALDAIARALGVRPADLIASE